MAEIISFKTLTLALLITFVTVYTICPGTPTSAGFSSGNANPPVGGGVPVGNVLLIGTDGKE